MAVLPMGIRNGGEQVKKVCMGESGVKEIGNGLQVYEKLGRT